MEALFENLIGSSDQVNTLLCYVMVCGLLLLSGLGLPIPEDIPLLAGGVMCQQELASLPVMIGLTFCFVLGADLMLFGLGCRYGRHVPRLPIVCHYLTKVRMAKAERFFAIHGGKTLLAARFLPGIRATVWFCAGACRIQFWKMLLYDGLAAVLSVPTLVLLGYFGAQQVEKAEHWARLGRVAILVVVVAAVVPLVTYKVFRRRKVVVPG